MDYYLGKAGLLPWIISWRKGWNTTWEACINSKEGLDYYLMERLIYQPVEGLDYSLGRSEQLSGK